VSCCQAQSEIPRFQTLNHVVPLKLDEVQPPEHVDGLRMEQNGHLNAEYKKEIIIGNHEEFERAGSEKKLLSRLKIVFFKYVCGFYFDVFYYNSRCYHIHCLPIN